MCLRVRQAMKLFLTQIYREEYRKTYREANSDLKIGPSALENPYRHN